MLRWIPPALLCVALTSGCSNSEFTSGAAKSEKKQAKDDPEAEPQVEENENPESTESGKDRDDPEDSSDIDEENAKEDDELDEDEAVKSIPGVKVTKVGVNFEDVPVGGDNDYNDAVLCFTGKFKVENSNVVSIVEQTVTGTTFSSSGCNHNVKAEVVHKDGSKEAPITYDSRATAPVTLKFKVGSRLEVYMTPYKGCSPGKERNMHSSTDAQVKPDLCNNK